MHVDRGFMRWYFDRLAVWWTITVVTLVALVGAALLSSRISDSVKSRRTAVAVMSIAEPCRSFKIRNGRYPSSESELEAWTGKGLPVSGWRTRINYRLKIEADGFWINTMSPFPGAVIFQYDSAKPESGVTRLPF
jgi:hypothetical protein